MNELYTTIDAAKLVHLSTRTLQQYRRVGGGPRYIKLGHRCLYDPKDLAEWIEKNKVNTTAEARLR